MTSTYILESGSIRHAGEEQCSKNHKAKTKQYCESDGPGLLVGLSGSGARETAKITQQKPHSI